VVILDESCQRDFYTASEIFLSADDTSTCLDGGPHRATLSTLRNPALLTVIRSLISSQVLKDSETLDLISEEIRILIDRHIQNAQEGQVDVEFLAWDAAMTTVSFLLLTEFSLSSDSEIIRLFMTLDENISSDLKWRYLLPPQMSSRMQVEFGRTLFALAERITPEIAAREKEYHTQMPQRDLLDYLSECHDVRDNSPLSAHRTSEVFALILLDFVAPVARALADLIADLRRIGDTPLSEFDDACAVLTSEQKYLTLWEALYSEQVQLIDRHRAASHNLLPNTDVPEILDSFVLESLRMHADPIYCVRTAQFDGVVDSYCIDKDSIVVLSASVGQGEKSINPLRYCSAKLKPSTGNQNESKDTQPKSTNRLFSPFGSGRRQCPGRLLVATHMRIVAKALLQNPKIDIIFPFAKKKYAENAKKNMTN
jgi:cytochrome P450